MSESKLSVGATFGGDFRIVRALRAGGMGAVYVVDQLSTGKQRALKVMAPELASDPAVQERFVLEARAAAKIESDHVVEIVTAGVDQASHSPFLVMELLRGKELAEVMDERGPLPLGDVAEVLSQVGHALEQAHAHGIVHRDLKPENIFLAVSKRRDVPFTAKILDFGIAKLVEDSRQKTGTQPLGTPLFMAPEQTDRKGKICPATDVWALGLITFRLLTGRDFWVEIDGSLPQLLREIVVDPIPAASARLSQLGVAELLPPGFDGWFGRCVNRDVDARFQEAGEAVRAFLQLCPRDAARGALVVQTGTVSGGTAQVGPSVSVRVTPGGAHATTDENAPTAAIAGPSAAQGSPVSSTTSSAVFPTGQPRGRSASKAWIAIPALAILAGGAFLLWQNRNGVTTTPAAAHSAQPIASAPVAGSAPAAVASANADPSGCPAGMVLIKGGNMVMGAKDASEDAKVTHKVTVSSFCLDVTEVTVEAYEKCVAGGDCEKALQEVSYPNMAKDAQQRFGPLCNARRPGREKHPINCVDWLQASRYCEARKARLPTEAEWEFAARGSSQRTFPWGDEPPTATRLNACGAECVSWGKVNDLNLKPLYEEDDKHPATAPVGSFPDGKSAAGVLDLAGNVWEWTGDWYAPYTTEAQTDPKGAPSGTERVVRGGAFNGWMPEWAKPAYRYKSDPKTYNHAIGFRCAGGAPK